MNGELTKVIEISKRRQILILEICPADGEFRQLWQRGERLQSSAREPVTGEDIQLFFSDFDWASPTPCRYLRMDPGPVTAATIFTCRPTNHIRSRQTGTPKPAVPPGQSVPALRELAMTAPVEYASPCRHLRSALYGE